MATMMLASLWACVYSRFLRGWLKWALRLLTGRCELQRICGRARAGARRTSGIEHSLELSKNKVLRNAVYVGEDEVEKCVTDIMKEKKIIEQKNKEFKTNLQVCLLQISGYKQLYLDVENLRKVPYDSDNEEHEEKLIKLWNLLMPHENLKARITKQWCNIGFQGDDPKTDFRGMGLLGLVNLVYSYAIVGINLTEMAYSLLKSGALKSHFYNAVPGLPNTEHFHQFYCYLVYEFDKFWFEEEPESIMHFNHYREKFHERVKALLLDYDIVLTLQNRREQ
ncbi:ELMO domain-containing protein 2 isoform X3 [Alligator sinensis]|uniref:ELMO domain-containing protein 2 isoform X3 n=1 Tax=Alligator sinensis TaxID=38654 RepID=A0A3Q0HAM1_ALLSI|nr:ELMO domain-containing protein 2 isoform X3 [Alligator sinensis]